MRNNIDALLGLGVLSEFLNGADIGELERKCEEMQKRQEKPKVTPTEGAKAAKAIFDSYVEAGFNEVQAFELLKLVLTAKR